MLSEYWDKRSSNCLPSKQLTLNDMYANQLMWELLNLNYSGYVLKTDLWNEGVSVNRCLLGSLIQGSELVGLDVSRETCHKAHRLNNVFSVVVASIKNLPFQNETFGLLVDDSTIDHTGETAKVLSEYSRVCNDKLLLVYAQAQPFSNLYHSDECVYFLDAENVLKNVTSLNFKVLNDVGHNYLRYLLVFRPLNHIAEKLPFKRFVCRVFYLLELCLFGNLLKKYAGFRSVVACKK